MRYLTILAAFLLVGFLVAEDLNAQRRGGGGRGGGGRSFSGGGRSFSGGGARSMGGGGYHRPSSMPSFNRPSPSSFNRPSPSSFNRPSPSSINRPSPSSFNRPGGAGSFQRPSGSGSLNRGGASSFRGGQRTASDYRGASRSQLNDFLNMPSSSGASGSRNRAGTPNESGGRTFEGENFTVDTFKGSGSGSSGGVNYAGAGRGAVITDSQGNQKVVGRGVGAASDGTNAVAGRGGFAGGTNTDGSAAGVRGGTRVATDGTNVARSSGVAGAARDSQGNVRGGAAGGWAATDGQNVVGGAGSIRGQSNVDGSGGYVARGARGATDGTNTVVQRGASAGVRDQYGNARGATVGGTRAMDAYGNTYGQVGGARYAQGPYGHTYARGAYATGYNGIVTSRGQAVAVRNGFTGYTRYYGPGWYARYPGAWVAAGIAAAAWWTAPSYGYASGYTDCAEEPVSYQYGDEGIYTEDGNVYVGDEVIATEEEYYDQAAEIADNFDEQKTDDADWMPLGVFAVVSEGQTKSDMTLQLAINKEGMIRGNLSLELTDEVIPVKGSLDKETQRVAFQLEGKDDIVVEAGLYNLTEDVLTVLVHQGKDKQVERGLVRLKQDEDSKQSSK